MKSFLVGICSVLFMTSLMGASLVYAQSDVIEELSSEIEDEEKNLQSIEAQIREDQRKLDALAGQKNTLQNTISNLIDQARTSLLVHS